MSGNFNTASRIVAVLATANGYDPDASTLEGWSAVFGIEGGSQRKRVREVSQTLELLSGEIDLLEEQILSGVAGAPQRYKGIVPAIQNATEVINFQEVFRQCTNHIHTNHLNLLSIVSDLTPDEGRVDEDALADITDMLDDLRDYAKDHSSFPFHPTQKGTSFISPPKQ